MSCLIDHRWKNIADGMTAFCVLGGSSTNEVSSEKLQNFIDNNFTIVVNNGIRVFENASMFVTADNRYGRKYFEAIETLAHFSLFDRKQQCNILYSRSDSLIKRPEIIKVVFTQKTDWNYNIDEGQVFINRALDYAKLVPNTWAAQEFKNEQGGFAPWLSEDWPEVWEKYGSDPQCIHAGGNISANILQLLWYMGFVRVVMIGCGDTGKTIGYEPTHIHNRDFVWDQYEAAAIKVHAKMWSGKRQIKFLKGGEMFKELAPFEDATEQELNNNKEAKDALIEKLKNLPPREL